MVGVHDGKREDEQQDVETKVMIFIRQAGEDGVL